MLPAADNPVIDAGPRPWNRWSAAARSLFTWAALLAMAIVVWRSRQFLLATWAGVSGTHVVIAIALWMTTHLVAPLFGTLVLGRWRAIGYRSMLAVHTLRLPAKYVPGGIWHLVGRVVDLQRLGFGRVPLVEFALMENLVAAGFALGVGAFLLLASTNTPWRPLLLLVGIAGLGGLCLTPRVVQFFSRGRDRFPAGRYVRLLVATTLFWVLASTAFVVFLTGFGDEVIHATLPAAYGIYLFSWGAGFVAFFAPQGVGVFEFVAGTLLAGGLNLAQAVALMASFRVVVLVADIGTWVVSALVFRKLSAT